MIPPAFPRGLSDRDDIAIGGGDEPRNQYLYRPGELIVRTPDPALLSDLRRHGYQRRDELGSVQLYTGGAGRPVADQLPELRRGRPSDTKITAHHVFFPCPGRVGAAGDAVATGDTFPPNLAPVTDELLIGVVDTGIVEQDGKPHPWFAGHVRYEPGDVDPLGDTSVLEKFDGHGTFVAGLLLREAPRATVVMKGVTDDGFVDEWAIARAIRDLATDPRIELINLSISGYTENQELPDTVHEAVKSLNERVVVVIAAGNDGDAQPAYPASIPQDEVAARLIAVGAVDETRTVPVGAGPPRAEFSNHGDWVRAYAHGVELLGTYYTGEALHQRFSGYALWSGTSFATATVTGRIAAAKLDNPGMTVREAADLVLSQEKVEIGNLRRPYVRGVTSTWPRIDFA